MLFSSAVAMTVSEVLEHFVPLDPPMPLVLAIIAGLGLALFLTNLRTISWPVAMLGFGAVFVIGAIPILVWFGDPFDNAVSGEAPAASMATAPEPEAEVRPEPEPRVAAAPAPRSVAEDTGATVAPPVVTSAQPRRVAVPVQPEPPVAEEAVSEPVATEIIVEAPIAQAAPASEEVTTYRVEQIEQQAADALVATSEPMLAEEAPLEDVAVAASAEEAVPETVDASDRVAATGADASPAADPRFDIVPVFFGTDRKPGPDVKRSNGVTTVSLSGERGRRLLLGQAEVTVPKVDHKVGEVERPFELVVLGVTLYREEEDPAKHFTIQKLGLLDRADFIQQVNARLAASERFDDHAFVFVHGFNVDFENALYRTAQIAYDLDFDGVPFLYSWPSRGQLSAYEVDQNSSDAAERTLKQFLQLVMQETNARHVHLIAHSMGNKPLLRVLQTLPVSGEVASDFTLNQVVLAAPDVDRDTFANIALDVLPIARGVTLYASETDVAMKASRNYAGGVRAGDIPSEGPLLVAGMDTIDVSAASTDFFALNHSTYAERSELLADIGRLMLAGVRPPEARSPAFKLIDATAGQYWRVEELD